MINLSNDKGLLELKEIIFTLITDLDEYARKPDSKEGYITKQNKLIQQLTMIYNSVASLSYYNCWLTIEERMAKLQKIDSNLSGYLIEFRIKPRGLHFSVININPYE